MIGAIIAAAAFVGACRFTFVELARPAAREPRIMAGVAAMIVTAIPAGELIGRALI